MIDAYLKTSMPVYDSRERQNHRNRCCTNEDFKLYTDRNHVLPFQLFMPDIDPVGLPLNIQVWDDTDTQLLAPDATVLAIANLTIDVYGDGINSWAVSEGEALGALLMNTGKYYLIIHDPFNDIKYYTELFTVCDGDPIFPIAGRSDIFTFGNMLSLVWWNECDFDEIIYQYGYTNRLILDTFLENPRAEITKNGPNPRLCETFYENIQHKDYYNFKIRLSKFAYYSLSRLPLYADIELGHVIIALPNNDWAEITDIAIDGEWDNDNCFNTFTLEFIQDCLVITNCCDNMDLSESFQ